MKAIKIFLIALLATACGGKEGKETTPATTDPTTTAATASESESPFLKEFQTKLTPEQVQDSLCLLTIDRTSGDFINSDEAWGKLELYKRFRERTATATTPYNRKTDVYGFVFGIDKVQELLDKIKKINTDAGKDSLVAIRVYYARTTRGVPDIFMVPISAGKKNVYPVDDDFMKESLAEVQLVLNTSVPCPNKCTQ